MSESRDYGESRYESYSYSRYNDCGESRNGCESRSPSWEEPQYNRTKTLQTPKDQSKDIGNMRSQVIDELFDEFYREIRAEVRQELQKDKQRIVSEIKSDIETKLKADIKRSFTQGGGDYR